MRSLIVVAAGLVALPWAEAATSCASVNFLPTPIAGYTCGGGGSLKMPAISKTITNSTANACAAACLNDSPAYKSIGFNSTSNTCYLYSKTINNQAYNSNKATDMTYWNPRCFTCAPKILSTSTTTRAATTKATTTKSATTAITTITTATVTQDAGAASTCTAIAAAVASGTDAYPYVFYARAIGLTESPDNPGNDNSNYGPITTALSGNYTTDCDAIQACAMAAIAQSYVYYSFDVHHLTSANQWICTMYYDPNWQTGNEAYFNVTNSDVSVAYGYYNTKF